MSIPILVVVIFLEVYNTCQRKGFINKNVCFDNCQLNQILLLDLKKYISMYIYIHLYVYLGGFMNTWILTLGSMKNHCTEYRCAHESKYIAFFY